VIRREPQFGIDAHSEMPNIAATSRRSRCSTPAARHWVSMAAEGWKAANPTHADMHGYCSTPPNVLILTSHIDQVICNA